MSLPIVRRSLRSVILLRLRGLRSAALRFRRSWRSGTRYLVSFPSLLRHREGNIRLRPAARRASAFPDSFPKTSVGPLPKKQPWALGSSHPSRPSRLSAPSRSGERNGGFNRMYQNRISLIGFTGKDAEARTTKNQKAYAVLSLATKSSYKD